MKLISSLSSQEKRLVGISLIPVVALWLYSFTQIDLDLTFSRFSIWQSIQKSFQYIGYFNRPLSTWFFVLIVISLTIMYLNFLRLALQKKLHMRTVWVFLLIAVPLLTLTYNAFSYDLFNYIFDAKILTHYHLNPYMHKALDFPGDPMLNFMRWTHRNYPYGPIWLGVTVPLSFIGQNVFVITYALFKLMIVGSFVLTTYMLSRIVRITKPEREVASIVFFALNPLVLIESLVSAHNDIVMICFMAVALYLLIKKSYIWSVIFYALSVGTKFATVFIAPVMTGMYYFSIRKLRIPWDILFIVSTVLMGVAVIAASINSGNFQAWYILNMLVFATLVVNQYYVRIAGIVLSIGALLTYAPFLRNGDYGVATQHWTTMILASTVGLAIILPFVWKFVFSKKK
jgi:hypothetical protein